MGTIVGEGIAVGGSVAGGCVARDSVATGVSVGAQDESARINAIVMTRITSLAIFIQSPSPTGLPQDARYYNAARNLLFGFLISSTYTLSVDHETIKRSPKIGVRAYARTPIFGYPFNLRACYELFGMINSVNDQKSIPE
jgi:hypothetical protein